MTGHALWWPRGLVLVIYTEIDAPEYGKVHDLELEMIVLGRGGGACGRGFCSGYWWQFWQIRRWQ